MKTAIIGTVGVPANYGGFETLVEQLILHNSSPELKYVVYCSGKAYEKRIKEFHGAELEYVGLNANGLQSIPYDILSLVRAAGKSDIILVLGVSGCAFLPLFRLFSSKKVIVNIDGLEHKRAKWKGFVKRFLKFSERMAVRHADVIVTDNKAITDYVKEEYGLDSQLIAYGGDQVLQRLSEKEKADTLERYGVSADNYDLALCRIEPENNVHMILEAYAKTPGRSLIFIGNWQKNQYGRELEAKYSGHPNIKIHHAVYNLKELHALREQCRLYLHGHSAGGTNPSLVEAMFFSRPIAAFDCSYNRETTENKAIYFKDAEHLTRLLADNDFKAVGTGMDMSEIANRRYRWKTVAGQYERLFR